MTVDNLTTIGFIVALLGVIVTLAGIAWAQLNKRLDACELEKLSMKQEIASLQEQIDALCDQDIERAQSKRITKTVPALVPRRRRSYFVFGTGTLLIFAALVLAACRSDNAPVERTRIIAPATEQARDLRQVETAAALAAADAKGRGDQVEVARQTAIAAEAHRLATEAEARAIGQQDEIDQRLAVQRKADADQLQRDQEAATARRLRLFAGLGIAGAIVAAIVLRGLGLPPMIATLLPTALAAGCGFLVVWPTIALRLVAFLDRALVVVGWLLALGLLAALAVLVRWLFREWHAYSGRLRTLDVDTALAEDAASRERQPAFVRWLIDLLHPKPKQASA